MPQNLNAEKVDDGSFQNVSFYKSNNIGYEGQLSGIKKIYSVRCIGSYNWWSPRRQRWNDNGLILEAAGSIPYTT